MNDLNEPVDGSVEAGLICLCAWARPGQTVSHRDIAKVCGVSRGLIFLIEKKALRKVREKLRRELKMDYSQMFDEVPR